MVICLERGADLHMAQLMSLSLASVKSPEKGPLNGCVLITGKKNCHEVIGGNCHLRLSHSKKTLKIFVWQYVYYLVHLTKRRSHQPYKNPIIDCTQLL